MLLRTAKIISGHSEYLQEEKNQVLFFRDVGKGGENSSRRELSVPCDILHCSVISVKISAFDIKKGGGITNTAIPPPNRIKT
jgi:hypothetical protein